MGDSSKEYTGEEDYEPDASQVLTVTQTVTQLNDYDDLKKQDVDDDFVKLH